jgi:hypothetical protein
MTIQPISTAERTFASAFSSADKLSDNRTKKLAVTFFNGLKDLAFYGPHRIVGIFVLPS